MEGVTVVRQDKGLSASSLLQRNERGTDIVRFPGIKADRGDSESGYESGQCIELLDEVVGKRVALSLIGRPQLVAVRRQSTVDRDGQRTRLEKISRRSQHRDRSLQQTHRTPVAPRNLAQRVVRTMG